jgi:hypothetical protein
MQKSILSHYRGKLNPRDFILALDDTDNPKYAKISSSGRFRSSKSVYHGQKIMVIVPVDFANGFALPLAYDFVKPKKSSDHVKGPLVAFSLVKKVVEVGFDMLHLVCDSWFDFVEFLENLESIGITYIWEIKRNRKVKESNSKHHVWKTITDAMKNIGKYRVSNNLKKEPRYICEKLLRIKKHKSFIKIIAVHNNPADKKPFAFYASSDTTISGAKIWEYSRARWAIEKLFRDLKQNLSFGTLATRKKGKCDLAVEIPLILIAMIRLDPEKFGGERGMSVGLIIRRLKDQEKMRGLKALRADRKQEILEKFLIRNENSTLKPRITACGKKLAA